LKEAFDSLAETELERRKERDALYKILLKEK
jgi:hypothetical protein